ncbi:uncharacterized protein LOC126905908 [Daktulosphaira vitifoliae]|uniref:uncharacterized protein LOC126905908 n=1 Tax=Daktulosphaira vitifoliae TaxID=58002 RepID=UPI0021AA840B|nr:uncharacterized protein LOC126905908 [Daktulosphaira vitifoliae]
MCKKILLCTFLLVLIITFKVYGIKNMIQDCLKCVSGIPDNTDIQRLKVPSAPTKVTNTVKSLRRGRFIFGDVIDDVINCFIKENKKEDTILYVSSYIYICIREKNFSPYIEYMTNLITQEKTIILVNIHVGSSAFSYHWVLGVINLVSKQIIILDSEKIIRINLYEILHFIMSSYFNIRTFYDNSIPKPIASE